MTHILHSPLARALIQLILLATPWSVRRRCLAYVFGWKIDSEARIGLSIILSHNTTLLKTASVGHFNVIRNVQRLQLAEGASIGTWNWIGGAEAGDPQRFRHCPERRPGLLMHTGAAITSRHILDCSDTIEVGAFSIVAGYGSQILTHGIDVGAGRQATRPVRIGEYCLIGSRSILLAGASISDRVVVGAGSVVTKPILEGNCLYAGTPARLRRRLGSDSAFFQRQEAYVE